MRVLVEAYTVNEAAVRRMDEIRRAGGQASDLEVTMHEPKQSWSVKLERLKKYASSSETGDNLGLRGTKKDVYNFLTKKGEA